MECFVLRVEPYWAPWALVRSRYAHATGAR